MSDLHPEHRPENHDESEHKSEPSNAPDEPSGERQDPVSLSPTLEPSEPEHPADVDSPMNAEQTADDLEEHPLSEEPEGRDMVITVSDRQIETDMKSTGPIEQIGAVGEISDNDLDSLKRMLAEESARRGLAQPRPFESLDTESLLVLYNQVRKELGSR